MPEQCSAYIVDGMNTHRCASPGTRRPDSEFPKCAYHWGQYDRHRRERERRKKMGGEA